MSTKIYNGFCMNTLKPAEILEFTKELREIMVNIYAKQYRKLCAEKLVKIVDELTLLDHEKKYEVIENYLQSLYKENLSIIKIINSLNSGLKVPEKSIEEIVKYFSPSYFSVGGLSKEIVDEKIKATELSPTILNQDYWIRSEIVLFPLEYANNKSKLLFTSYGDEFTKVLFDICNKETPEYKALCEKYGIKEYHYQNSTDKPDNVTDKEWDERAENWNKVWQGPANQSGIPVLILDSDMFLYNMRLDEQNRNNYIPDIKTKDERINKVARDKVLTIFCEMYAVKNNIDKMEISDYSHAFREFNKEIEKPDSEIACELEKEKKRLSEILIDIDENIVKTTTIVQLIPNYMALKRPV